ncbi:MAG: TatD family hydrolase [Bacteroidales bacterium]|nr:TatD family hydrolase [Bacteroidales bacterium]
MISKETPFVDIHTHHGDQRLCTCGIHPWWLDGDPQPMWIAEALNHLESLLKENKIVAIGETGIDRFHQATLNLQLEVFEKHILLSEQYQKPLIIHGVKATADILRLHKKHQPKQTWIIHGFNGNIEEVRQLTERGVRLSVGESLFYPNRKIHESLKSIPLDDLFLETDTSGKTIQEVYEKAAELLNLSLEVLKERIFANFAQLNIINKLWNNGTTEPGCSSATLALTNLGRAMC